jgi:hypothetical protein
MATKAAHSQHRSAKSSSSKSSRSKPGAKRSAKVAVLVAAKTESKGKGRDWPAAFLQRDKKYAQHFGATVPKGKLLSKDGSLVTPAAASREGIFIAQYAPTPERMSWMYVTHGLSQTCLGKGTKPCGIELILQWRDRQTEMVAKALLCMADYVINNEAAIAAGELVTGERLRGMPATGFPHWVTCACDKALAEKLEADTKINFVTLIGVSDAEMQVALKVNAQLADGRQVLLEALRVGGIFPVTDATRNCLTRRRDFHRVWETAFHNVREKASK